uniref:Uncharacterized protein n=1 Tax=Tanacetum cinerariifolium TaxID=118510 RepID=A0A6L2N3J9_TANCI|nr:hypothetical protein [Tanacetum cinerariifolium]GEU79732.1 hypothetical protein [Tanacetum cinerariifolium]
MFYVFESELDIPLTSGSYTLRCDDKTVKNTDHEDGDQEDGKLPDFPTFSITHVFASVCEKVDENIDISIVKEKEEVPVEDVEMDGDHDVPTARGWIIKVTLACGYVEKVDAETLTRPNSSSQATEWFKRLVTYAQCNSDSYETIQVEAHGVVLEQNLAIGKQFKSRLVGCYAKDNDELIVIKDVARDIQYSDHTEQIRGVFRFISNPSTFKFI